MPKCKITWSEPNRGVAECVLALGGTVEIGTPGQRDSRPVQAAADLHAEFFQVRRVSLAGVAKPLGTLTAQLAALNFAQFDRLESLDLSGIAGLDFRFVVSIHGLNELALADIGMRDVGLATLPKLPTLQRLVLDGNAIGGGGGLTVLGQQPALTELSLVKIGLTDESLTKLPKLPALKRLVLDGNEIRGTGLTHLSGQPELIDLSLNCPTLTDLLAKNLAELKPLKRLSLAGSGLSDAGIKHLAGLTNLESLDLRRTKATAAGISELQKALPNCKFEWDGKKDK
jgi:Leucine Rich Repeat (LRR) protein